MRTVDIIITVAKDGFYCAACEEYPALFGGGKTPESAVEELRETLRLVKEDGKQAAAFYPDWLEEDFVLQEHWDVETMLRYYSGIITPTALGKLSGIHPKQLWSYMHGKSKPRKGQVARIEHAVHQLGQQLLSINF